MNIINAVKQAVHGWRRAQKRRRMSDWHQNYAEILSEPDVKRRFDRIYADRIWSRIAGIDETASGGGSTLISTEVFRLELESFLRSFPHGELFDAPCGDFNFMRHTAFPPGWSYIGGDIAPRLVDDLRVRYPGQRFIEFDLRTDRFPACSIWLCRACLFHLSYADIRKVLANFVATGPDLALITSDIGISENQDIRTGDFRPLDLTLPPFNLPKPRIALADRPAKQEPCIVGGWSKAEIASALIALPTCAMIPSC